MAEATTTPTTVSGTLFDGSASDKDFSIMDSYIDSFESKKRALDAKRSGLIDSVAGLSLTDLRAPEPPQCKKPIMLTDQVQYEKSGFLSATEKLADKVKKFANSCEFRAAKDVLKGIAQYKNLSRLGEDRIKAALVGLSTALPFQLSQACQNIVDNFAAKVAPKYNGYERLTPTGSQFIQSDQVECAMDALSMLTGIRGLKGQIKNTLIDLEATATVIAGMVTTLIDYGMIEDIEAVVGTSPSTRAAKRAIGLASSAIVASGNLQLINWMLDEIGVPDAVGYDPDLCRNIVNNYEKIEETDDQYFFDTLYRVDPEWDKTGDVYYFDVIRGGSPSAQNAFENYDPFRTLNMVSDVVFFDSSSVRYPTIAEVTQDLYPEATGRDRKRTEDVGSWLLDVGLGINMNNPLYFYL